LGGSWTDSGGLSCLGLCAAVSAFTAVVHHEDDGTFWAEVEELPGCFASGDSCVELLECLAEAIALHLSND
jgi:predicted RNase H-like HicB family nuclease